MSLDPWIIEQLKKEEERNREKQEDNVLRLPLYDYFPIDKDKKDDKKDTHSRVIVLEL